MLITFIFVFSYFIFVVMMCFGVLCVFSGARGCSFACKLFPASHLSMFVLVPADSLQLSNGPTRD